MKNSTKIIILAVAAVLVILIILKFSGTQAESNAPRQNTPLVQTEKPHIEDISLNLSYNGDIGAIQQANIFSKVSGNIEKIFVDIGSAVRKNQLLAIIDSTELYQQYQQTAATFNNAKISYERTKQLYTQRLIAQQDQDNAEAAMKVAQANYATATTKLSYARITAPFRGYITKRFLDRGALVQPGTSTLFTLMKMDSVKVIVNVLEKDIPLVAKNKKALITVDAFPGKQFNGVITRMGEAIDLTTRTMAVEVDIPNPTDQLKPGMFANVSIMMDKHPNAVTLPTQALMNDPKGNYVFVFQNGKAKRMDVKTGIEQNSRTEILQGLNGSEDVITTGQQFLKDGVLVKLQNRK